MEGWRTKECCGRVEELGVSWKGGGGRSVMEGWRRKECDGRVEELGRSVVEGSKISEIRGLSVVAAQPPER
ncbi:hypothetical protein Pmani_039694 [Petrolisthes manimaculis]|uniref:Uncharacterized protein n=1 Tax=Petrolisthes manimaculis TaxID=1843537 RepID=A0AAE1ND75_9EUCA|nr:hypothetical protein Pmani_039694 [Petrolisthes manimaculis]